LVEVVVACRVVLVGLLFEPLEQPTATGDITATSAITKRRILPTPSRVPRRALVSASVTVLGFGHKSHSALSARLDAAWEAATEQQRRILIDELLDGVWRSAPTTWK
jgi:hypothetical protein